jgi:hypothetical protein
VITDAMLKKAAAEAGQAIQNSLPATEDCDHHFSLQFEHKMKHVLRKEHRLTSYQILRRVACFIAAIILASSIWLTIDTEARAAFFAWVKERYQNYVVYRFTGESDNQTEVMNYELGWLPEGFEISEQSITEAGSFYIYQNDQGQMISFICSQGTDATALFLISDDTTAEKVSVGELSADFYRASDGEISNALVWLSETGDTVFCITAPLPEQTLIQIAESIQEK